MEEYQTVKNKIVIGISGTKVTGIESFGVSMEVEEFDRAIEVATQISAKFNKEMEAGISLCKGKNKCIDIDIN